MVNRQETFNKAGKNTSTIAANASASAQFVGAYYVEMTDWEAETYGACNVLSIANTSDQDAEIWFGMEYPGSSQVNRAALKLPANTQKNINFEDGRKFYRFRIVNLHASTAIPAGDITWAMSRVIEVGNGAQ